MQASLMCLPTLDEELLCRVRVQSAVECGDSLWMTHSLNDINVNIDYYLQVVLTPIQKSHAKHSVVKIFHLSGKFVQQFSPLSYINIPIGKSTQCLNVESLENMKGSTAGGDDLNQS